MKKWIALALAVVMVLSMNVMAFAESQDITVTVIQYDVQSVNITWESLDFVYKYTAEDTGSWNKESANVTVRNDSNHSIYFDAALNSSDNGRVANVFASMEELENVVLGIGQSRTFSVKINGKPSNFNVGETTIGNVTITIRKAS